MLFEKINIMNKYGTAQRCLQSNEKLLNLFHLDLQFRDSVYHIVTPANHFIGTLSRETLLKIPADVAESNPDLQEVCNIACYKRQLKCSDAGNLDQYLQQIADEFNTQPYLTELPITDSEGRLIAIADKYKLFAICLELPRSSAVNPICDWDMNKSYKQNLSGLNAFAKNINSQHGEDGIIERLFSLIGFKNKYAVEFGGWDGVFLSNTRNLIVNHGFKGLFIEGDSDKVAVCQNNYKDNPNVKTAEGYVGFKKNRKLSEFLEENEIPREFDLLSIDIDGYDYHVWASLNDFYPRVVIIEFNPTIPNDVFFITPDSEDVFMGSSASAMVFLAQRKGYELVSVTQTNCIFVREEEFNKVGILDNRLSTLRSEDRLSDGKYFQSYNKEIYFQGFGAFVWSGESFHTNRFDLKLS